MIWKDLGTNHKVFSFCYFLFPTTLGSVAKVVGLWEKACKNAESVMKSPTGW